MTSEQKHEARVLERHFYDLYGVFMKSLSFFVLETKVEEAETIRLCALLQEMIEIKRLLAK